MAKLARAILMALAALLVGQGIRAVVRAAELPGQSVEISELLRLHNYVRAQAKKNPLRLDLRLCAAAQQQADYCAQRGRLDHFGPWLPAERRRETWCDRARAAGYGAEPMACAENLAGDFGTPRAAMLGWLQSPGHMRAIVGDYVDVGLAVRRGGRAGAVWCAVFCRPGSVKNPAGRVPMTSR